MKTVQVAFAACVLSLGLLTTPVHAVTWVDGVGSRVAFNRANSVDLASYCNGGDLVDDTTCIGNWLTAAYTTGKDLYVSPGTYLVSYYWFIWSGFRLQCADPTTTIFKKMTGHNAIFEFVPWQNPGSVEPFRDASVENCGFDINGFLDDGLGVLVFAGQAQRINHITLRGNRVFDATMPGTMCVERTCERAYFVLSTAEDILIENNQFSEGGRVKVAFPAVRTVIRNNTFLNINDNAITVVDSAASSTVSENILITGNTITNPLGSSIFFGADGQGEGTPTMTTRDVTITNNTMSGDFMTSCIQGTLPNNVARIYIANNSCAKIGTAVDHGAAGIALARADGSVNTVQDVTIINNTLTSTPNNMLATGPIFIGHLFNNICLLDNTISNNTTNTVYFYGASTGKMTGNNLGGGSVRIDFPAMTFIDTSGSRAGCYVAPALDPCYD